MTPFLLLQWQMHSWSFHQLDKLIRKGVPGLQGSLVVDSAWSWIPTQTFHRTSDGVAGRLAQEVQMVLLSVPICWECVWADSWFPTMLNCRSCCHWSSCAGKSDFPVWSECFPSDLNSQLHFSPKTAKYSWEHLIIPDSKLFRMMLSWLKQIFVHVTTPWYQSNHLAWNDLCYLSHIRNIGPCWKTPFLLFTVTTRSAGIPQSQRQCKVNKVRKTHMQNWTQREVCGIVKLANLIQHCKIAKCFAPTWRPTLSIKSCSKVLLL